MGAAKLERMDQGRLARECAKLDRVFEQSMADEGIGGGPGRMARVLRGAVIWADLNPVVGHEIIAT